jgi:signal transduction histidine kinase
MTTVDLSDPSPRSAWWLPVLVWTAAVLLYAVALSVQIPLPFRAALESSAVYLYSLALLTIPGRRWSWRDMAARRPTPTRLAGHLAIGVVTIAAWFGVNMLYQRVRIGPYFWQVIYTGNFLFQVMFAITVYGMVLGVTLTAQSWRRERERERREAELTILARDAELGAIRAQFQPHFVLNALNSLLALIDQDPALARTMVVRLADVMKAVFDRIDLPAVTLDRELDLVKAYLDVEHIRFGARLTVALEIDDAARSVMVPPFLLQPIVENAVKHGVAPYAHAGRVRISARVAGGRLLIEVQDSGSGILTTVENGTGRGLQITRRRLDTIYGDAYELRLDRRADGTSVHLTMPLTSDLAMDPAGA